MALGQGHQFPQGRLFLTQPVLTFLIRHITVSAPRQGQHWILSSSMQWSQIMNYHYYNYLLNNSPSSNLVLNALTFISHSTNDHHYICEVLMGMLIMTTCLNILHQLLEILSESLSPTFVFLTTFTRHSNFQLHRDGGLNVIRVVANLALRSVEGTEKEVIFYVW